MKRFLGTLVLMVALVALAVACGSGGGKDEATDGVGGPQEGQAPPTAVTTAMPDSEPSPAAASGLREQMGELVLGEGDVPAGLSMVGSMDLDMNLDFLGVPAPQGGSAYMSMFASPDSEEMIVSMVILMDDDTALDEAFSQIESMGIAEMQDAFNMVGAYTDVTLLDTRELDVSGLGDQAYGIGLTMEMAQVGTMDSEMVLFGEGPLLAMAMTMTMGGGSAVDVVPLAQAMADRIEAALQ
ncbi:MAG: hypothetical protein ACUVV3_09710 [Dehalococcoidia bacterium]